MLKTEQSKKVEVGRIVLMSVWVSGLWSRLLCSKYPIFGVCVYTSVAPHPPAQCMVVSIICVPYVLDGNLVYARCVLVVLHCGSLLCAWVCLPSKVWLELYLSQYE